MKRLFDIIVSLSMIIALLPVIIVISILIMVKMGNPVFFMQSRPGKDGKIFNMIKFRTMLNATDSTGALLSDDKRMTAFGSFLRSTSLDELPELINVIKGDMSLVGPRPLLVEYLPLYSTEQARRHNVRPGVTGWAQINGRNAISWKSKFELDVWYVDNQSFLLDIKILFLTFKKVVFREDISADDHVTMEPFKGNEP